MLSVAPDCFLCSSSSSLLFPFSLKPKAILLKRMDVNWASRTRVTRLCRASLITNPDSFEVGRLIGSYGFMNVTSYSGFQSGADLEFSSPGQLRAQDVGEGNVKIRLYEGRIAQGLLKGTPVIFKVYPGKQGGDVEADMMAANELNTHAFLQSSPRGICKNILLLLGGFETKTGEQWLAFRNDGKYSGADYAKITSEQISRTRSLGEKSLGPSEQNQTIKSRRHFVVKILQGAMSGLAYMHNHDRLHQSLGPASVVLNTIIESDATYLVPRVRDLAFSVDISFSNLEEDPGRLSEGLWRRAFAAGAVTPMEKRAFGIADDMWCLKSKFWVHFTSNIVYPLFISRTNFLLFLDRYEAGLLFAYLAFVPFCEAGTMDSLSLQRLLESTFQLDVMATREYCLADDCLLEAVKFLDLSNGAGWELLQAMLNPDFRKRPIAESVLNHRFLTASVHGSKD